MTLLTHAPTSDATLLRVIALVEEELAAAGRPAAVRARSAYRGSVDGAWSPTHRCRGER